MKLFSEFRNQDVECLVEEAKTEGGKKKYVIEGIFAQADKRNKNGRIYPMAVMESAVNDYKKNYINEKRSVGELNHPVGPAVNLDKVSHLITDLRFEGADVYGKANILPTPMGKIVEGLIDGGVKLGVSTRGMGSIKQVDEAMVVGTDFRLCTVDIVQDPSAQSAFVNGIMEGVDWIYDNGILKAQDIEEAKTEIENAWATTYSEEAQLQAVRKFLLKLSIQG